MSSYGPVRGYYPWEDRLVEQAVRSTQHGAISKCARSLGRSQSSISSRAMTLKAHAEKAHRRAQIIQLALEAR